MVVQIKDPPMYDTSHWKVIPDFAVVDPRPRLVLTKATEGTRMVDPTFIPYFQDLLQDGIRRGCFHFFRKAQNALEQAKHFCNTIRPHITEKDILVLDVEEGGETAGQLWTWCEYVRSQFPSNLLIIYSRKNILEAIPTFLGRSIDVRGVIKKAVPYLPGLVLKALDYLFAKVENRRSVLNAIPMTMAERAYFKRIPTWPAGYPFNPDIYSTIPSFYVPDQTRWGEPWLWQYSDQGSVRGISNEVDLNLAMPALLEWLGSDPTPVPDPEPPTDPDNGAGEPMPTLIGEVIVDGLNIRPIANTSLASIGKLNKFDLVEAAEEFNGWWKLTKITRGAVNVPLPGPACYAYEGATNGYIKILSAPPPTTEDKPQKITVEMASGKVFVADQFTEQV